MEKKIYILTVSGTEHDLATLKEKIEAEELDPYLSGQVIDVGLSTHIPAASIPRSSSPVQLMSWLKGEFEAQWQSLEVLLTPRVLSPVWMNQGEAVERARLLDLGLEMEHHNLVLILSVTPLSGNQVEIQLRLRMKPETDQWIPLPPDLRLLILDGEDQVFKSLETRSTDHSLQYRFSAEHGDRFKLRVILGESEVNEEFIA